MTSLTSFLGEFRTNQQQQQHQQQHQQYLFICRERSNDHTNIVNILDAYRTAKDACGGLNSPSISLVVGSEGGWSEKEMALFDSLSGNSDKVVNVCLGSGSVLRAETAAVMAVGCLNIISSSSSSSSSS